MYEESVHCVCFLEGGRSYIIITLKIGKMISALFFDTWILWFFLCVTFVLVFPFVVVVLFCSFVYLCLLCVSVYLSFYSSMKFSLEFCALQMKTFWSVRQVIFYLCACFNHFLSLSFCNMLSVSLSLSLASEEFW